MALPRVSFILPTLNVEALLDNCLASIARQTYPRECYEIILGDANSTDRTPEIARKYGAKIVSDAEGTNIEHGKRCALQHATGEYIVFMDADNEITHNDYIELAVKGLEQNPQALGVESYYLPSPKMSSFCAYLTHLLQISDPICWLMSSNPILVERAGETERWKLPEKSMAYPLGSNGFVFRRADLDSVNADQLLKNQDTAIPMKLMESGKREWLRVRGRGVHHYYVQTLWGFVKKRRRATVNFLRVQEKTKINWMNERPPVPIWLATVYCISLFGPLYHALRGIFQKGEWRWLWHLPASPASVLGNAWGVWTYHTRKHDKKLIANLKPEQALKSASKETGQAQKQEHALTNGGAN